MRYFTWLQSRLTAVRNGNDTYTVLCICDEKWCFCMNTNSLDVGVPGAQYTTWSCPECKAGLHVREFDGERDVPVARINPDTDRCPDCEGQPVYDEATHHLVCEACGQRLRE